MHLHKNPVAYLVFSVEDGELLGYFTIDKKENVKFYTEKCGFDIVSMEMDGNVKVARFVLEK